MRILNHYLLLCTCLILTSSMFVSCEKPDEGLDDITVKLIKKGSIEVNEGVVKTFEYDVVLNKSLQKDVVVEFVLKGSDKNPVYTELFTIEKVPVKAGKTKGLLKIISKKKTDSEKSLKENVVYTIDLKSVEGVSNSINLDKEEHKITVKADKAIVPLTLDQKKLVAAWKKAGIDLSKFIGKVNVSVKVTLSTDDAVWVGAPFSKAVVAKTYTGQSLITVSSNATAVKPVLKISKNAMGLNEFLQQVFRKETVENTEYWYRETDNKNHPPAPKAVVKAMGAERYKKWKNKEYDFNVKLDNIEISKTKDNKIAINFYKIYDKAKKIYSAFGSYDTVHHGSDPSKDRLDENRQTSAVHFTYDFKLYDEVLDLAKNDATKKLYPNFGTGGSVHPDFYITGSGIDSNEWDENLYVKPSATFDVAKGTIQFVFPIDWTDSQADYAKIEVTYTSIQ